ncbi:MAG TPA: UDP-N-acetylmuramate dehydrogenase, partial [Acidobacteriaceae bacterium]|nr:UDP-N-acetylmuramate dehydrogenase [Acidobacteriaceae bacterium]
MTIQENVALGPLTTLRVGGPARYFAVAENEQDVAEAVRWAEERGLPLFVLGGGSNLLVSDAGFPGVVLQIGIRGVKDCGDGLFEVGAGEVWDEFVDRAVKAGMQGVECLAGIPGSVGGTPVQNVGAYGQEVAETIVSVRAFDRPPCDRRMGAFVDLDREACKFRYRQSLFNTDEPGRYIVTHVDFQLHPDGTPRVTYGDVKRYFAESAEHADLHAVASAVREIRQRKGMLIVEGDPDCRSAGSFFKNPVVSAAELTEVAVAAGVAEKDVPHWPLGDGDVKLAIKLSAAWLIERAGFGKGFVDGAAGISSRHTLALINRGGATAADIERLQDRIQSSVRA